MATLAALTPTLAAPDRAFILPTVPRNTTDGPPKQLEVETPGATTIVEGSEFNLKVEDDGQRAGYHVEKLDGSEPAPECGPNPRHAK